MSDSIVMFLLFPALFLCILLFVEIGRRMEPLRVEEETERERLKGHR